MKTRVVIKTVTWRAISVALTFFTARAMGLTHEQTNTFTLSYALLSSGLYYAHERAWSRFKAWKRQKNQAIS
jgi:uncharacterized membrane protein